MDAAGHDLRIFRYDLVAQPVPAQGRVGPPRGRSFMVREISRPDPGLRAMPPKPTEFSEFANSWSARWLATPIGGSQRNVPIIDMMFHPKLQQHQIPNRL